MNSSHNHQSSAVKGGQGAIATPANSGGSGIFGSTSVGATHGPTAKETKSTSTDEGARRASQDTGLFGNLNQLKRNSNDMNRAGRKNSMAEQSAQPGIMGQMFNKLTKDGEHK